MDTCLPMQGTRVWSLILVDSTCCGATKACTQQLAPTLFKAREPQLLSSCAAVTIAQAPRSFTREATAMRSQRAAREQPPLATTRESLCTATKTQGNQKQVNTLTQFKLPLSKKYSRIQSFFCLVYLSLSVTVKWELELNQCLSNLNFNNLWETSYILTKCIYIHTHTYNLWSNIYSHFDDEL